MTPEQDCQSVWDDMATKHPEFTRKHDPTNNWHAVRELILGGSLSWADANARFQPFAGARVMDLGANVGIFTAYCAIHGAAVSAYECDPETFAILSKMTHDTGLQVDLHNTAVWIYGGYMPFEGRGHNGDGFYQRNGNLLIGQNSSTTNTKLVPCVAFDDAIGDVEWDCVKFDIEGAEFEILLHSQKLSQIKFINVELHPGGIRQDLYDAVIEILQREFKFEGVWNDDWNRWQTACLTRP